MSSKSLTAQDGLPYKDLEDYGIIGNLETCAALVGRDGSIDWLCFPYLESPSIFAALLDVERGGHFGIKPTSGWESIQSYVEDTNILQTTFGTHAGTAVITDFMLVQDGEDTHPVRAVFRKIACERGQVELEVSFQPRFHYARTVPGLDSVDQGIIARWEEENIFLHAPIPLAVHDGAATGVIKLHQGQTTWWVLQYQHQMPLSPEDYERLLKKVKGFWLRWAHKHRRSEAMYDEPWHDLVIRAGLVLKLLTNPETGAIAAAPTTSLPENIGGVRNWDYRFAWIRDASFTVQAFFHLGHVQESEDFRRWMREIIRQTKEPSQIRVLYGLHGETDLEEQVVDSLFGYKNSSPVRIGNDAAKQNQLDIYGELLNAIYDTTRYGENISQDLWSTIRKIVDYVCQVWDTKDAGIWEIRGEPRHFVYSKLMCWVAIDRGTKIARLKGFEAPVDRWKRIGEEIRQAIVEKGFSHIGLINGALYLGIAKGRTHQGPKPLGVV